MPTASGTATLLERHELTPTLARFRFALDLGVPDFLPGQFITLGLPGGPRGSWRAYSLASPPHEKRWVELYVREAVEPVPGRLTTLLFHLQPGDAIPHRGIAGAFTVEETRADGSAETRSLLCVASGTGVAPFISYAESLRHRGVARRMVLAHGARTVLELGYAERLREIEAASAEGAFRFVYVPTISRPTDEASAGWTGEIGRVETLLMPSPIDGASRLEKRLGEDLSPLRWFAHACGFEATVTATFAELEKRGFLTRRFKRDDGSFDLKTEIFG